LNCSACNHPKVCHVGGRCRPELFDVKAGPCDCRKYIEESAPTSDKMTDEQKARKADIEVLKRKAKAARALIDEVLNRLQELDAA
jgi:hypothetical protein